MLGLDTASLQGGPDEQRAQVLHLAAAPRAQGAINRLCEGARATIVIDLRELTSVDSVGMHTLMAACEAASDRGHDLRVLPGARIRNVQELTDVLAGLPLLDSAGSDRRPTAAAADSPPS